MRPGPSGDLRPETCGHTCRRIRRLRQMPGDTLLQLKARKRDNLTHNRSGRVRGRSLSLSLSLSSRSDDPRTPARRVHRVAAMTMTSAGEDDDHRLVRF